LTTDTVSANAVVASAVELRPSLIDRLLTAVDALPGPAVAWYVGLAVGLLAVAHAVVWVTNGTATGSLVPEVVPPALLFPYFAWLLHTVNHVASSAFDEFRPALGGTLEEQEHRRHELTSIPDRLASTAALTFLIIINVTYVIGVRPSRPASADVGVV
jgi:hypothetical protein